MRPTAFVGVAIVLLASHAVAAEPNSYCATITDPEVIVRASPSDRFSDTGTLKRGTSVTVVREESNGWLAIEAPQGSISWIAFAFVDDVAKDQPTPKHGVVNAPESGEVTLACGKVGLAQPLEVRRQKLPEGSQVTLIGPPVDFGGKKWWPILPPAGDVRYIPKTAAQIGGPANNNFTVRVNDAGSAGTGDALPPPSPSVAPLNSIPTSGGTTPAGGVAASKPQVNHPLWAQAETAEREGRLKDAEKAYFELAGIMSAQGGDLDLANLCFSRVHALREKQRGTRTPIKSNSNSNSNTNATVIQPPAPIPLPKEERPVRPGIPTALPPAASTNNSNSNTSSGSGGNADPNAAEPRAGWYGPGILRRSVVTPDGTGKPAYALESSPGDPKVYVIAAPGVDLAKFVNKRVEVYGEKKSNPRISKPYVVATNVEAKE